MPWISMAILCGGSLSASQISGFRFGRAQLRTIAKNEHRHQLAGALSTTTCPRNVNLPWRCVVFSLLTRSRQWGTPLRPAVFLRPAVIFRGRLSPQMGWHTTDRLIAAVTFPA